MLVIFKERTEEMNVEKLEEHANFTSVLRPAETKRFNLLHHKHSWKSTFFRFQLLRQIPSPRLESLVDVTEFLQLSSFTFRFVDVRGIIKVAHQVARDLAES